jgi:hypothetical protein
LYAETDATVLHRSNQTIHQPCGIAPKRQTVDIPLISTYATPIKRCTQDVLPYSVINSMSATASRRASTPKVADIPAVKYAVPGVKNCEKMWYVLVKFTVARSETPALTAKTLKTNLMK